MWLVLVQAGIFLVRAAAVAGGVLIVGGAVKKVMTDPADDCIDAGLRITRVFVAAAVPKAAVGSALLLEQAP